MNVMKYNFKTLNLNRNETDFAWRHNEKGIRKNLRCVPETSLKLQPFQNFEFDSGTITDFARTSIRNWAHLKAREKSFGTNS
jgi:hypothetical protein